MTIHPLGLHRPSLCSVWLVFLFACPQHPIGVAQGTETERLKRFRIHSREQQRDADHWLEDNYHKRLLLDDYREPCPCAEAKYCSPIGSNKTNTVNKKEVYGFAGPKDTGEQYNWTYISTVAWAVQDELMCRAHQHASRAILGTPSFNLTYLAGLYNPNERSNYITDWVQKALFLVTSRHRDGVVFDYEEPLESNSSKVQAYVDLINATRQAFHAEALQVSTCVAWSPNGIDGRYYPYSQLANVSDLLYVMDYDTQSQITQGPCMANANAPLAGTKQGIQQYLRLGIDPDKLILGVPWYGYQYPCLDDTLIKDRFCPIRMVPFRGVDCSDAAGWEVPYSNLRDEFYRQNSTEPLHRDSYMDASYFNSRNEREGTMVVHQSWFDDPTSMRHKFSLARSMGLRGVGPYVFGDLNPLSQPMESSEMWTAFDAFFHDADAIVVS